MNLVIAFQQFLHTFGIKNILLFKEIALYLIGSIKLLFNINFRGILTEVQKLN